MESQCLLEVENLGKKYCRDLRRSMYYGVLDIGKEILGRPFHSETLRKKEFWALDGLSFSLRAGECLGIIGANGSGKSTLLKIISGILPPDKGVIRINGRIGSLIEIGAGFHPLMSGRENIYLQGTILGLSPSEIRHKLDEIIDFSGLGSFIDMPVKNYSSGMYLRLGFSIAAQLQPEILLIDEVLAVGDSKFRHKCYEHIRKLINNGTSLILVSHSINDLLRTSARSLVLDRGGVLFSGNTEEAIAVYQKNLSVQDNKQHEDTYAVSIDHVALLKNGEDSQHKYVTHDNIWIEFGLTCKVGPCNLETRFVIDSQVYGPIATVSSLISELEIAASQNEARRYAVEIPEIPLLRGAYTVHLHIFNIDSETYLGSYQNLVSFEITGVVASGPSRHLLYLESNWYGWHEGEKKFKKAELRKADREQTTYYG